MKRNSKKQWTLTKGEMDVMKYMWKIDGKATVKEILEMYDEPMPAYTTVATFLKILTNKGFLLEEKFPEKGKCYFYSPLVSQEEYTRKVMDEVTFDFFGGSVRSLVNFFMREEKISAEELAELLNITEDDSLRN